MSERALDTHDLPLERGARAAGARPNFAARLAVRTAVLAGNCNSFSPAVWRPRVLYASAVQLSILDIRSSVYTAVLYGVATETPEISRRARLVCQSSLAR